MWAYMKSTQRESSVQHKKQIILCKKDTRLSQTSPFNALSSGLYNYIISLPVEHSLILSIKQINFLVSAYFPLQYELCESRNKWPVCLQEFTQWRKQYIRGDQVKVVQIQIVQSSAKLQLCVAETWIRHCIDRLHSSTWLQNANTK